MVIKRDGDKMGLYKLRVEDDDINKGVLEKVVSQSIDYEKLFESWLENSPDVLLEEETILWIGRQLNIQVGDGNKYPDLIGINSKGDIVICELKKGKTPREVIAQILEYASWAKSLTYEDLNNICKRYYQNDELLKGKELIEVFKEVFYPEDDEDINIIFNNQQRLFIIAEEISKVVLEVINYLNSEYFVPIIGVEYSVYKSSEGEFIVNTNKCCGFEKIKNFNTSNTSSNSGGWNECIPVKDVIYNAVKKMTSLDNNKIFKPIEVIREVEKNYPNVNKTTVRCQLIQDCVNHTSRKHYPNGQRDLYFLVSKGNYRLYNKSTDGVWNFKGESINKK